MTYNHYARLAIRATTSATASTTSTPSASASQNATATHTVSATPTAAPARHDSGGFPFWTLVFVVGALALAGFGAVFLLRHLRRTYPGRPPLQALRAAGAALVYRVRNPRERAAGAGFEGISAGPARPRGMGGREGADEAWDARVADERFYEEEDDTELHAAPGSTEYRGASGAPAGMPSENPFGDDHAVSLRSVSPRPDVGHRPEGESGAAPRQFV